MIAIARSALWVLLGTWLGGLVLFAVGVAPTAFRVLPSAEIAGGLVSPLLRLIHLYGVAAGVATAVLSWLLGVRGWRLYLPLALGGICFVSEFGVTRAISEVLPHDFGPDTEANAAERFQFLHRLSRWLYSAVTVGVLGLVVSHGRQGGPPGPDPHVGRHQKQST